MVAVESIGAGGGSIAHVDVANALKVGPRSAGAVPGPACYGVGGTEATVTDANLVLGRLNAERFLGGEVVLDVAASEAVIGQLVNRLGGDVSTMALGIVTLANFSMASAI